MTNFRGFPRISIPRLASRMPSETKAQDRIERKSASHLYPFPREARREVYKHHECSRSGEPSERHRFLKAVQCRANAWGRSRCSLPIPFTFILEPLQLFVARDAYPRIFHPSSACGIPSREAGSFIDGPIIALVFFRTP